MIATFNQSMGQGRHAEAAWSTLIIFAIPELGLLVKVIFDQAAAMRCQPRSIAGDRSKALPRPSRDAYR